MDDVRGLLVWYEPDHGHSLTVAYGSTFHNSDPKKSLEPTNIFVLQISTEVKSPIDLFVSLYMALCPAEAMA